jgi:hypothetical protein
MISHRSILKLATTAAAGTAVGVLAFTDIVNYNNVGAVRIARAGLTVRWNELSHSPSTD